MALGRRNEEITFIARTIRAQPLLFRSEQVALVAVSAVPAPETDRPQPSCSATFGADQRIDQVGRLPGCGPPGCANDSAEAAR